MPRKRCYQEGSLSKQGTRKKVWVARWRETAIGPNNVPVKIRRKEILGPVAEIPTKREARQMLAELMRKVNGGDFRPQAVLNFRSFVEDRWKPDAYINLKFSTKKYYDNMIDAHLNPAFGDTQLRLITRDAVQNFLMAKIRNGSSSKTVSLIRTAFGTIIEAAVMQDLMIENPVRKTRLPRRGPVKEQAPIESETVTNLIAKLAEPSRSIASLLVMTGLRIGELLGVTLAGSRFAKCVSFGPANGL